MSAELTPVFSVTVSAAAAVEPRASISINVALAFIVSIRSWIAPQEI
jgi:hypothetical protein